MKKALLMFFLLIFFILISAPVKSECSSFDRQIEVLALNMYHEARGEGPDAMQMVGEVTLNRVDHSRYPNNICAVVYQRSQFSWTRTIRNPTPSDSESWGIAVEIATGLLDGARPRFNTPATHFLNPQLVSRMPSWTRVYPVVSRMGNHVFYESI